MLNAFRDFLRLESASGIILVGAAMLAMVIANSPLVGIYGLLVDLPVEIRVGNFEIAKPLLLWINDGLMALFFLLVGLELKREIVEGQLSDLSQASLPVIAAIGGILVPALIYAWINQANDVALQGWASLPQPISPSHSLFLPCWAIACHRRCDCSSCQLPFSTTLARSSLSRCSIQVTCRSPLFQLPRLACQSCIYSIDGAPWRRRPICSWVR